MKLHLAVRAILLGACVTPMAWAAGKDETIAEVIVFARGDAMIGTAVTASEGAVGGADLAVRPLLRVAELLEAVPGLIAVQHSGSGKANQYFLRGFNLDHGTDFTTYVDDVPMNLRTHGHGQGYLDVNGLIPEVVARIDYRKGTYRADVGDFSIAGASFMSTVKHVDTFTAFEGGDYGWRRVAGGSSVRVGQGELAFVGQWKEYEGPFEQSEDLRHQSMWAKYSQPTDAGELEVTFNGYHAKWKPTEQVPERAIGTSVCEDAFCALDPTARGETLRYVLSARLTGDDWKATLYGQYYDWHMLSNPTYDFQINQFDRRWIGGGRVEKALRITDTLALTAGTEGRYDDIGNVGVEHTEQRRFIESIGRHAVREGSLGVYSEATWTPVDKLRILAGLRGDYYDFDVRARLAGVDEGSKSDSVVSPKLGFGYTLTRNIEVYGNWGRGFHSNDARGVVNEASPINGLSKGEGEEVGLRFEFGNFNLTTTYWWLDLDSELKFVGDSNSVEPGPATQRRGYEVVSFWRPLPWLALDAVWTGSHARYDDNPDGRFVSASVENAGELGIAAIRNNWDASVRVRYLGEYPLLEDNSERASPETTVNVRLAWKPGRITTYAEVLNVLDDRGKDIVYFYESNIAGLDPDGEQVDGRLSRVAEPRTLRFGVSYKF